MKRRNHLYYQHIRQILLFREQGFGYGAIARKLDNVVSEWTIRNWIQHIPVDKVAAIRLGQPVIPKYQLQSTGAIRRRLIAERGHRCENCELSEWLGKPIALELHKHRIPTERKLLCPNCHAQTDDWRSKTKSSGHGVTAAAVDLESTV